MSKKFFTRSSSFMTLFCALLMIFGSTACAKGCTQYNNVCAFIKGMKDKVSVITKNSCSENCTSLEAYVAEILDLDAISKFVMGRHWTTATNEQKQRFSAAYGSYIQSSYAAQLRTYVAHTMRITYAKQLEDSRYVVRVRLDEPDDSDDFLILEFHIKDADGILKIIDVKINNTVSLAGSQRSSVDSAIKTHGLDNVILLFEKKKRTL